MNSSRNNLWLLVGLGNPGPEHEKNRHNAGYMVADLIQARGAFPEWRKKFLGLIAEKDGVALLKPITFMNLSGESVGAAARYYKIPPERIVVFHDELDLEPGDVRIKQGGGHAGHNGLKSIAAHLNTPDFWRVRVGIGHPGERDLVSDYVLSNFSKAERGVVSPAIEMLAQKALLIAAHGVEEFEKEIKKEEGRGKKENGI